MIGCVYVYVFVWCAHGYVFTLARNCATRFCHCCTIHVDSITILLLQL